MPSQNTHRYLCLRTIVKAYAHTWTLDVTSRQLRCNNIICQYAELQATIHYFREETTTTTKTISTRPRVVHDVGCVERYVYTNVT